MADEEVVVAEAVVELTSGMNVSHGMLKEYATDSNIVVDVVADEAEPEEDLVLKAVTNSLLYVTAITCPTKLS